jgi:transcription elongation GreA/GreB family factor
MADPQAALANQLRNIEAKTGQTLAQLRQVIVASGLAKHGEVRAMLMQRFALGHGDANTLAHAAKAEAAPTDSDALDAIYSGAKAALRPLHDAVMQRIHALGPFEIAPKKTYLSLRRKKQFAMVGPATKDQIEIGLNAKSLPSDPRLKALPPGGMCQYTVRVSSAAEIDAALIGWVRAAYEAAG